MNWLFVVMLAFMPEIKRDKIMPSLKEILQNAGQNEQIAVLVHLSEHPDYESLKDLKPADYVNYLKYFSELSQGPIIDYLFNNFHSSIFELQPYWIFNGLYLKTTKDVIQELAKKEEIEYIIEDFVIQIEFIEGEEIDPSNAIEWNILRVRADSVWMDGFTGQGVIIGHMDTGVDANHPALSGKWVSPYWYDGINGQPNPYDDHGHGTHTMGTILGGDGFGPDPNDIGVAPDANFVACKICDSGGSCPASAIHNGFQKIAEWKGAGVNIVAASNSWGSNNTTSLEFWTDCLNWRNIGVIPVFAIGNNGDAPGTAGTPGNFPVVIGVGSTNSGDLVSGFSSRGPAPNQSPWNDPSYWPRSDWNLIKPNISAPGENIRSSVPGGGYQGGWNGTSMATPHVAGAIALMYQKNPTLDFTMVYNLLLDYARQPSQGAPYPNNNYGWGILNCKKTVDNVPAPDAPYIIVNKTPFVDGNNSGIWDPGEEINLTIQLKNVGVDIDSVQGILRFTDPYITLIGDSVFYHGFIAQNDTSNSLPFTLLASSSTPSGYTVTFTYHITGAGAYTADRNFSLTVGLKAGTPIVIKPMPGVPDTALIYDVAFDGTTLYITEWYGSTIYKLDPDSLNLLGTIPAPGNNCTGITYDPAGYLWVHRNADKMIYKINPSNGAVVTSMNSPASAYPTGLTYDPNTGYLWVTDRDNNKIYEFDPNTQTVVSSFNVPYSTLYGPRCSAFEPNGPGNGSLLHVATFWSSGPTHDSTVIMEIDLSTGQVVPGHRLNMLFNGRGIEFDPRPWNGYYTYWATETNSTGERDNIYKIVGFYAVPPVVEEEFAGSQFNYDFKVLYLRKDGNAYVKFSIPEMQKVHIKLFDVTGRVLNEIESVFEKGIHEQQIKVKNSGIYFVTFESEKGAKKIGKLLKVK